MVLQVAIDTLNETLGKAIGRIENAIAISEQAQKASLSLGMSLEGANKVLDGSIKGLRGDFGTKLQAGITALNAGFQGNIQSVGKLINQQQLTRGQFKETARSLSKLETVLGLSRDETSQLADTILETNRTFSVSTDKLVTALGSLEKNLAPLDLAGLGGVIPEALVQLAGQMGPQVEKQLASVMGFLFDPSMETQGKLAALGLGNLREKLAGGASPVDTLLDAFDKAAKGITTLAGDTSEFYAGFSVPLELFGPVANDFIALQKAMNKRERTALSNQGQFFDQINVLMSEILAPLDELFSAEFYPVVKSFVKILSEITKPVVQTGIDKLKGFLSEGPDELLMDIAKTLDPILNFLIKSLNAVSQAMAAFAKVAIKMGGLFVTTGILDPSDIYGEIGKNLEDAKAEKERLIKERDRVISRGGGNEGENALLNRSGTAFAHSFPHAGKVGLNDPILVTMADVLAREAGTLTTDALGKAAKRAKGMTREEAEMVAGDDFMVTTMKEMNIGLTADQQSAKVARISQKIREQENAIKYAEAKMQKDIDAFADSLKGTNIPPQEKLWQRRTEEYLAGIAASTEETADHTDPEKIKSERTYLMDSSIQTLGETLLSITRQSIDGPDEYKEAVIRTLGEIRDKEESSGKKAAGTGM